MKSVAIKVENVNKLYKLYDKPIDRLKETLSMSKKNYHKEHYALNSISFEIKKGETVGIIGTNGSGKSTLLKMITGVLTPTSGKIIVNGKISALLELGAGFNPEYTGIENIYLNGTMMGYSREDMKNKIDSIIEFADIGQFINQPVKTYSSGMFVRLAFAVAINLEPDILIVDEALSVGDNRFQAKCYSKIEMLREKGKTILMVTHDVDSVRRFCDRCIWIDKGGMKEIGDVKRITSDYLAFTNKKDTDTVKNIADANKMNIEESKFEPISRWGSCIGLIKRVDILNEQSKKTNIIYENEKIKIYIVVQITAELLKQENVGIAFSIKNQKNQDLIVLDTFNENLSFVNEGYCEVIFELNNYLVKGDYYLVVSLEYRENSIPSYIDYIDGAYYFKSDNNKSSYGMIKIPYQVEIINK